MLPTAKQFDALSVHRVKLEVQSSVPLSHNFHEFAFICSGQGTHLNHGFSTPFKKGDFFLIKPYERHAFVIKQSTEAILIRFTEATRMILKRLVHNSGGRATSLSKAKSPLNFKASFTQSDEALMIKLLGILEILSEEMVKNENICYYQLLSLISIVERNLSYFPKGKSEFNDKPSISKILNYIHRHLQEPQMLELRSIADKFNMSINQLGLYFRKNTNQPVKRYINECRLQLIGKKVKESDMSFSEIAYQFGFVDESHFYKRFKNFFGITPTLYRKSGSETRPSPERDKGSL